MAEANLSQEHRSDWDPWGAEASKDPFAAQAELRAKCPIAYTDKKDGFWSITKYADIVQAATDTDHFKNGLSKAFTLPSPPLESDPPEHTYFRKLLQPFFTPARMRTIEGQIRTFAREILAPLVLQGGADFADKYSFLLPVRAFCFLLNLPDGDWEQIKIWSTDAYSVFAKIPELREKYEIANAAIYDYTREVLAERRRNPRDPADDLVSAMIGARYEDQPLKDDTIVGAVRLLLTAGHESTAGSIGNCILYLAQHEDAQLRLRREPSLILPACEEILRWESPIMGMPRVVAETTEVGGHVFRENDRVYLLFSSANRDEDRFAHADKVDFDRKPNPHMVFGWGRHTCLGAPLARVEIRVALEELLDCTKHFELSGEPVRTIFHRRGVLSLQLACTPASPSPRER